jgi:hypothetical protein
MVASHSETIDAFLPSLAEQPAKVAIRFLRGKKMATTQSLFDEFAAALQFPYYFGNNWAAFDECLADLSWLPAAAYVMVIFDSTEVLCGEKTDQLDVLLNILERVCREWSSAVEVGESWDRPPIPFHIVFHCTPENLRRLPVKIVSLADIRLSATPQ